MERDRTSKKRLYARAGIPVYWIIDLVRQSVEVYTDPFSQIEEPTYQQKRIYTVTDAIAVVIEGREVGRLAVRDLLP